MAGIRARINAELDTSRVDMQFNKMMSRLSGKQINFNVNARSFTQPLGRITASANEFTKSLEASNARVIAFGASVGIINAVSNAFKGLVAETIKFEKTLADINVILNTSNSSIQKFGSSLFDVAKNTAQSFDKVADAALEFSRQGLTMEETLRRTSDALILTRLTSLKAEEAVAGLTAAVNAFGSTGETTTSIIDKLAAVDVKFAVSSEDLINALERTGAVAIDAGVELDNLIGLVTALQQTTARGGSVIGNGLKTIFTRIQRPQSIKQLEEMGIAVRDLAGSVLPADKILVNIAKSFNKLSQAQQSNIVQFSAGIFQANIFRASLRDLAKEQNLYSKASEISATAAGNAAVKNEQLNKTISALASQSGTAIMELAEAIGELTIKPELGNMLSSFLSVVEGFKESIGSGEDEGNTFAKGLIRGVGNVLTGPALFAFGAVFIKMLANVAKFASQSLKDVLGITTRKEKIKTMEESIVNILSRNKHLQEALNELEGDRLSQEQFLLKTIEAQTNAMARQKNLAAQLAKPLLRAGVRPDLVSERSGPIDLDGDGRIDTFSGGAIPKASKDKEKDGARRGGYAPGIVKSTNIKGIGDVIYNTSEKIKKFKGLDQPAIMPPQGSKAGRMYGDAFIQKHGFDPYASSGFIPNLANQVGSSLEMDMSKLTLFGKRPDIERAFGIPSLEKEFKDAAGAPIVLEGQAGLEDIVKSTGAQDITKTRLFKPFSSIAAQKGITTIKRPFQVRALPRGQIKDAQDAERKATNLLNREAKQSGLKQTHTLTSGAAKNKKGRNDYPVDIIAYGSDLNSHEVKSGKFSMANIISKSLRMSSDRELATWMSLNKVSGGSALTEANLKKAQSLAGKLKIAGTGTGGEFTQKDADLWGMSEGLVPNFKKDWNAVYEEFVRIKDSIKSREDFKNIGIRWTSSIFPKNKNTTIHNKAAKEQLKEKYDEMWNFLHSLESQRGRSGKYDYNQIFDNLKNGVYKNRADLVNEFDGNNQTLMVSLSVNQKSGKAVRRALGDKKYNEYINLVKALPGGGSKRGGKGRPAQYIRGDAFEKLISEQAFNRPFMKGPQAIDIENINPSYFNKRNKELFDIDGVYLHGDPIFTSNPKGHMAEGVFKKLANSIETKKQIDNRIMDITSRPGRRPSTIDFGAFPFADMIGNSSRRGIKFVSESVRPVDIRGRLPEMLSRIDPYTNMEFSYMRDYLKVPDKQKQILYSLKRGSKLPSSEELGEGLSYDGFVPNFGYIPLRQTKNGKNYVWERDLNIAKRQYPRAEFKQWDKNPKMYFVSGDMSRGPTQEDIDKDMLKFSDERKVKEFGRFAASKGYPQVYAAWQKGITTKKVPSGYGRNYDRVAGKTKQVYPTQLSISQLQKIHVGDISDIMLEDLYGSESFSHVGKKYASDFVKKPSGSRMVRLGTEEREFGTYKRGDLLPDTGVGPIPENTARQLYNEFKTKYGASEGLIPNFAVQLGDKYFDRSQVKQGLAKLYKSKTGKKADARALDRAAEKYIALIEDTGRTYPGGDFMIGDKKVMANEVALALMNHGQFYKPKEGETVQEFSKGLIPNFANPLADAISREHAAGLPMSKIRVDQSDKLKGPLNPMGLAVTNTRDEPLGVEQGIRRAKSMRMDPKTHGASRGVVPNFIAGAGVSNTDKARAAAAHFRELNRSTQAIRENTNTVERKTDADRKNIKGNIEGLQKLFYFQSALSMANGFLEEFAESGQGLVSTFADLGLASSNIVSAYVNQAELIPELSTMLGADQAAEPIKANDLLGMIGLGKIASGGGGKIGSIFDKFKSGIGGLGKTIAKFLPIIGKFYIGLTAASEAFKFLQNFEPVRLLTGLEKGEGIMDLMASSADRAAKSIESLGKASDAVSSALEALRKESKINEEITELEVRGKRRTAKEESRLIDLRVDVISAETNKIKAMEELNDVQKVGNHGLKLYNTYVAKLNGSTEQAEAALQEMSIAIKQATAVQTVFKSGAKSLENASSEDFKERAIQVGKNFFNVQKDIFTGGATDPEEKKKNIEANLAVVQELIRSSNKMNTGVLQIHDIEDTDLISNAIGNLKLDESVDKIALKDSLTGLYQLGEDSRSFDNDFKVFSLMLQGGASSLGDFTEDIEKHSLDKESIALKNALKNRISAERSSISINKILLDAQMKRANITRDIVKKDEDLLLANNLLSSSIMIQNESIRRSHKLNESLDTQRKEASDKFNESMLDMATDIFNSGNVVLKKGPEALDQFNEILLKGANIDSVSLREAFKDINDKLPESLKIKIEEEAVDAVRNMFKGLKADNATGVQGVLNTLQQRMSELDEPTQVISLIGSRLVGVLGLSDKMETTMTKSVAELSKANIKIEEGRKTEEMQNNEALRQLNLKQKTVQGAMELANIISRQGKIEDAIEESLMGEAAYLKVLNDSLADRVKITQESKNLEALVLERLREKSRKEAEASIFSSAEADANVRIRTGDPATLSKQELEARQNMLLISQGKVKQEISSAQLSAEDASVRKDILSSAIEAAKLAESKLSTDMDIAQGDIFLKNAKLALLADEETRRELVASTVDNEILDQQISLSLLKQRSKYLEQGKNRAKIAKTQNDTEIEQLELDTKMEAEKLKQLQANGGIAKIAALQLDQSIISLERDGLIALSKQRQLNNNLELEKRQAKALENLEVSRRMDEHRNARLKANMSQDTLSLVTGMDIETGRFNAQSNMRSAATRASITGKPEDIAAFSRAMLEFKESTQEGASAFDKLRVKMAETSVAANETGAALLATYDTLRSELKQAFKDIGSGKRSMGDAMEDVMLKSLGAAFDKITEQNIDNFTNTLFKGLTGIDPAQDAKSATEQNTLAVSKLTDKIDEFLGKGGGSGKLSPEDVKKATTINEDIEKGKKAAEDKKQVESTKQLTNAMNQQNGKANKPGVLFKTQDPALKKVDDMFSKIGNLDIGGGLASGIEAVGMGLNKAFDAVGSFLGPLFSGKGGKFYGGQIQKFNNGGFVQGPKGVDNIPAMLSSGEYVMSRGEVQKFNQGGEAKKEPGFFTSLLNTAVDLGVQNYVGRKYGVKNEDKDKPPEFDKTRLNTLGMGSTVDLGLGSSQLTGRFMAQNKTIDEYGGHLMDLHDFKVAKQNEKTNKKLQKYQGIVGKVAGMVGSSFLKALPAIGGAVGGLIGSVGGAIGSGISSAGGGIPGIGGIFKGIGGGVSSLSSGLGGAVGALSSFNLPGAITSLGSGAIGATTNMTSGVGGTLGKVPGVGKYLDAGVSQFGQTFTGLTAGATSGVSSLFGAMTGKTGFGDGVKDAFTGAGSGIKHALSVNDKWRSKQGTKGYFMGGSVPAMLTKGESVVPSAIAKRMGYNNLKNINRSGELPIVDGPGGIDNVGPVPMTPGDFVIKRSSTQKLAKKNPHLMKLAMQNPGVFRNGGVVRGYYNGGVVGSSEGTSVVPQYDQPSANQQDQSGAMQTSDKSRGSTTNNINITVNIDEKGGEKTTSDGSKTGATGEQQLSMKIKSAVLEVIREEKRVGGELS
jgi:TP901 family phage tail tape measure protein